MKRIVIAALAACLAVSCIALAGCGSKTFTSTANTGKVAATVNGVDVMEDDVTKYIEDIRTYYGYTDDDSWGEFLNNMGYTPESLRSDILDSFIDEEVVRQAAAEKGISISEDTIDYYVESVKSQYSSQSAWESALKDNGMTEDEYRKNIEDSLLSDELQELVVSDTVPEETILEYCNTYRSSFNGAKRSSHILFDADDEETAKEVLDKINAGTLKFEDAAKTYSLDGSGSDGGDVGWDALTTFVDEYQTALDGLSEGEVSGLVTSTYGIHIIKCTEEFTAPDEITKTSQVPEDILEQISSYAENSYASTQFQEWIADYREDCDIVINDMPEGMSYAVDMSKYKTEESETAETTETVDDEATDEEETD